MKIIRGKDYKSSWERQPLNPSSVDAQARLLASQGIKLAFIPGSTGESSSMQLEERKEIYSAWKEASAKYGVDVIAHTGSNSVWDCLLYTSRCV